MRWSRKLTEELNRLSFKEKAALADYLYLSIQEAGIDEGVRRMEDIATGKVRGLSEKEFLKALKSNKS
jgi:hypothetical protein